MAGPTTSKHTTEWAQTRWNRHEQGQGQGEWRLMWGQAREGNVVTAAAAAAAKTAVAMMAGMAAAGQEQEWEHQQLQE